MYQSLYNTVIKYTNFAYYICNKYNIEEKYYKFLEPIIRKNYHIIDRILVDYRSNAINQLCTDRLNIVYDKETYIAIISSKQLIINDPLPTKHVDGTQIFTEFNPLLKSNENMLVLKHHDQQLISEYLKTHSCKILKCINLSMMFDETILANINSFILLSSKIFTLTFANTNINSVHIRDCEITNINNIEAVENLSIQESNINSLYIKSDKLNNLNICNNTIDKFSIISDSLDSLTMLKNDITSEAINCKNTLYLCTDKVDKWILNMCKLRTVKTTVQHSFMYTHFIKIGDVTYDSKNGYIISDRK